MSVNPAAVQIAPLHTRPSLTPIQRSLAIAILAAASVALVAGWRAFWFLTDDAHIAFRYVSNSVLGFGYTWNPPPFRPVEGYTSFLWVVLLDIVWRTTGVQPPEAANWLSLLFAFGSLGLAASWVLRMRLHWSGRARILFLALVLAAALSNRTFLAWTSSGLESAMFNFLVLWWLYVACRAGGVGVLTRWIEPSLAAALITLTRPDGLLFVGTTLAWIAVSIAVSARQHRVAAALSCAPLLIVPAHLIWRFATYGAWLPNTYNAKITGPWPAAGVRYLASFALEYAYWLWGLYALAWGAAAVLRARRSEGRRTTGWHLGALIASATCILHVTYYVLIVGGDHFEWRVLSYLVIPFAISLVAMLDRMRLRGSVAAALFALWLIASLPIPWIHWLASRNLDTRDTTFAMKVQVAPRVPATVQWYARAFDDLQRWLIESSVCNRHQEHRVFYETQREMWPSRGEGSKITSDGFPVLVFGTVGVPGWVLPHVAIIDTLGLNDYVVARTTSTPTRRIMAHEKVPPPDYVQAFRPDVGFSVHRNPGTNRAAGGRVLTLERRLREQPLTADEIRQIEARWWKLADAGALRGAP